MPTITGSWAGSGRARGRLILVYSQSNGSSSSSFDITLKAEADYSVYDSDNTLTRSGSLFDGGSGSVDLSLASGQTKTIWTGSKTVSRADSSKSYSMAFKLSGVNYWGSTASVSTNVTVPALPQPDPPATPTSVSIAKVSNTSAKISWSGGTAHHVQVRGRSVNGDGGSSWNDWNTISSEGTAVSSGTTFSLAGNRDYQARVRRKNDGGWSGYGTSSNTARLYDAPNAPTGVTTTRSSDSKHTVKWSGSSADGKPIRWVDIERYNGVLGAWGSIATGLAASTRSYTDTANMWDNTTRHRVRFRNSAGSSAWAYGSTVWTTPAAPGKPTAKRSGGSGAVISWTNNARKAHHIDVSGRYSTNGGTSWSDWGLLTGRLSASAKSTTLSGLAADRVWQFRIRAVAWVYGSEGDALFGDSAASATLQLLAPPNAPKLVAPVSIQSDQAPTVFRWVHQPVDGSDQEAAEVRYRIDGGEWVTLTATTAETVTTPEPIPAGELEWQARTRGSHATFGPWSGVSSLLVASPPGVTILTPTDGETWTSNRLTIAVDWEDAQDAAMVRWTRRLLDDAGTELENVSGKGSITSTQFTTVLTDLGSYVAEFEATSGTGLSSGVASVAFTVDFLDPEPPVLTAEWIEEQGLAVLAVTNTPGDSLADPPTADTVSNRIERTVDGGLTWTVVADDIAPDSGAEDRRCPLNTTVQWRAVAISALGVEVAGEPVSLDTDSGAVWLEGENGATIAVRLNLEPGISRQHEVVTEQYLGHAKPTAHFGAARPVTASITGDLIDGYGMEQDLGAVLGQIVWYRDPLGNAFAGAITDRGVDASARSQGVHRVTFSVVEVEQ